MLKRVLLVIGVLACGLILQGANKLTRMKGLGFAPVQCDAGGYVVPFDTDIQALMNRLGPGAKLCFQSGVYRVRAQRTTPLTPVAGQSYNCAVPRACVLTGAMPITGWVNIAPNRYMAPAYLPSSNYGGGNCLPGFNCTIVNDVFVDGVWQTPVTSAGALASGTVYLDYANNFIFLYDNPAGHTIEQSGLSAMFDAASSEIDNVTIRGLVIDKVATAAQHGAIDAFRNYNINGWVIDNVEVRWAHGAGIELRSGTISNSYIHHNGQEGYVVRGTGSLTNSEIAFNNFASFDPGWEAGAGKIVLSVNYVVDSNNVHDNQGTGIWADVFNYNTTITNNTVVNGIYQSVSNVGINGIEIEISNTATITGNTITTTTTSTGIPTGGLGGSGCYSGGAIFIVLSPHVVIANNSVTYSLSNGICIDAQQSARGCSIQETGGPLQTSYPNGDSFCPVIPITPPRPQPQPETFDVNVHDNTSVQTQPFMGPAHYQITGGWAVGVDAAWWPDPAGGNLRWSHNTYCESAVFNANGGYSDPNQATHTLNMYYWQLYWEPTAIAPTWPGCIPP